MEYRKIIAGVTGAMVIAGGVWGLNVMKGTQNSEQILIENERASSLKNLEGKEALVETKPLSKEEEIRFVQQIQEIYKRGKVSECTLIKNEKYNAICVGFFKGQEKVQDKGVTVLPVGSAATLPQNIFGFKSGTTSAVVIKSGGTAEQKLMPIK